MSCIFRLFVLYHYTFIFQLKIKSVDYNILKERFETICDKWKPDNPVIYAITPTYKRPVQRAELTRYNYIFVI